MAKVLGADTEVTRCKRIHYLPLPSPPPSTGEGPRVGQRGSSYSIDQDRNSEGRRQQSLTYMAHTYDHGLLLTYPYGCEDKLDNTCSVSCKGLSTGQFLL